MVEFVGNSDFIAAAPPGTVRLHECMKVITPLTDIMTDMTPDTEKQSPEFLILAPGTSGLVLQPQPSSDPNDPLVSWFSYRCKIGTDWKATRTGRNGERL